MREILFRGKRKDNQMTVKGYYICLHGSEELHIIVGHDGQYHHVSPETVSQFTGLTDKNGKKIFEGDIVKWDAVEWGTEYCEPVVWDYSFFGVRQNDWKEFCEVIGNIHDNPELLE